MNAQYIKLNIVPSGVMPILYCSQYDIGRPLGVVVYNGGEAVELNAYSVTIEATRTDGTAILVGAVCYDNIATFATTPTMTNVKDSYIAQLVLTDENAKRVASLPFMMRIIEAAMDENAEAIEEDASLYQQYTEAVQILIGQIRTDLSTETGARQSADSTLQSAINAETSARQSADATLQSNLDSETSARQSADSNLQSQISQIVAPSGEAPSAAEVQNARIGANGVTYSTIGEAIRGNDEALGNIIKAITETVDIPFNFVFRGGFGINSTGHFFTSEKRIATQQYYDVTDARFISYQIEDGYRVYGAFYNGQNDSSSFVRNFGWLTGSGVLTVPDTALFIRVSLASIDDATALTVADAANLTMTYQSQINFDLSHALVYRGLVGTGTTAVHSTIEEATQIGIYNLASTVLPSDAPSGFTGGALLVLPAFTTKSAITYDTQKIQVLVSTSPKFLMMRHNSADGVWRDWVNFSNSIEIVEETKWLALGDSITYGVYSDSNGSHSSTNGWVKRLATSLKYVLNNMGVRGMGYIAAGGNNVHWSDVLDTVDTLTDSYNLITVSLGINDYNTSSVTVAQIESAVETGIQRLMAKFPEARLVFITPFNSNRRGDAASQYCYNYAYSGRSLKDIADAIQAKCAAYGVECIYATNGFLLNTYNMATLLPDQTHPSSYCHTLIAKNMAHYLLY